MNRTHTSLLFVCIVLLGGCASVATLPYNSNPDTVAAIRSTGTSSVRVVPFTMTPKFQPLCRAAANIAPPTNATFEDYISTALANELKWAGRYDDAAKITLSGSVENLAFSSSDSLVNGRWDTTLRVSSSNGASVSVSDSFPFDSGFMGGNACRRVAEAFMPAMQRLVKKLVDAPQFPTLMRP